tara:strand:- start:247 stop:576 length:330 start_codon:yes stop_codon:yes gene_type:complete
MEHQDIKFLSFYLDNIDNYFYIDNKFIENNYNSDSNLIEFLSSLEVDAEKKKMNKQITESIRHALKELFNISSKEDFINSNNNLINDFFKLLDFKIEDDFLKYYNSNKD